MHALYINVESDAEIDDFVLNKIKTSKEVNVSVDEIVFKVFYDPREWSCEPILETEDNIVGVAGWFILNGKKNDLEALLEELKKNEPHNVIRSIEHGVFTAFYLSKADNRYVVFSDPMGLSSSYYKIDNGNVVVSASAKRLVKERDKKNNRLLEKINYIPGVECLDSSVKRLCSGDLLFSSGETRSEEVVISNKNTAYVHSYRQAIDYMNYISGFWDKKEKHVPISSGFDSRLIAIVGDAAKSYTWGPENAFDIKAGRTIAKELGLYHYSFRFLSNKMEEKDKLYDYFVCGAGKTNINLVSAYGEAFKHISDTHVCLDGYLGDVLQRGTFLFGKGVGAEFKKFFPSLVSYQSESSLLKDRLKDLDDKDFETIWSDYSRRTGSLKLAPLHKVSYYECFYGRGGRHAIFGGNTLNAIFNTVVPLMFNPAVFTFFFHLDPKEVGREVSFVKLWKEVDEKKYGKVKKLRSENFVNCYTPPVYMSKLKFLGRIANNYIPCFFNYTKENIRGE
ncbi:hypothetical protein [Kushneria phosphatilytica]|uniref:Uncharacterized protein n=1 Tax=Kushneria phosphatilytica TaxID=657387 RepID=A0A1S1NST1_9GAMM|nr:hypothetical protein [Kushneria phosphatilytica]OHV09517.1 hypothetical protein BH688_10985 [Kushneria phosphatilytica]QEL11800.1 hypothetical protein FY550_12060 [Kushneria phosphatilytica]